LVNYHLLPPLRLYACASISLALSVLCTGEPAQAKLAISTASTKNVSCQSGVCTATAADAVLNVSALQFLLASSSVAVKTGTVAIDIEVDAALTWVSANGLTLDAYRSITINGRVSDAGSGPLVLTTNGGGKDGALGFGPTGKISFMGTTNALTIDGVSYTLKNSIAGLASAISANPQESFALAKNYDASHDGTYKTSPIRTSFDRPFVGSLEGLGNTISHLSINDPSAADSYVGLIAAMAGSSAVSDLRLSKMNVVGQNFVGGVVGLAYGGARLTGDDVEGVVRSEGKNGFAGGIAGAAGYLENTTANVSVTGRDSATVGGLAGSAGPISNSHASGTVTGGQYSFVGGLTGNASAKIANSYETASVTGGVGSSAGGLAAFATTLVVNSYARGAVHGDGLAGGLVGEWAYNGTGAILKSYATGAVSGGGTAGGLVGNNTNGRVARSFATGDVNGGGTTGGLVGVNGYQGSITNAYATGAVKGGTSAGGFAGTNSGAIHACYSTGVVTGPANSYIGGFAGTDTTLGGISSAYWDTSTSGIADPSQGAGNYANDPGITGETTTELQSGLPEGFSKHVWGESAGINGGLPYLLSVPPPH
jgi:hypothetical protein